MKTRLVTIITIIMLAVMGIILRPSHAKPIPRVVLRGSPNAGIASHFYTFTVNVLGVPNIPGPGGTVHIAVSVVPGIKYYIENLQAPSDSFSMWMPAGQFLVFAEYDGDDNYSDASNSIYVTLNIKKAPTFVSIDAPVSANVGNLIPITV